MKKIKILTFHRAINYGAFLQSFSLFSVIKKMGHDVQFLDFYPKGHSQEYNLFSFGKRPFYKKACLGAMNLLISPWHVSRKRKMERLQREYLNVNENTLLEDSEFLPSSMDAVVYGSDQIWRKHKGQFDFVYWGDGIPSQIRKVSYAASMGEINIEDRDKEDIYRRLIQFYNISVRESGLKEVLQTIIPKPIQIVVDPVFLTTADEWRKYKRAHHENRKYLFLFNLKRSRETEIAAAEIAANRGLQIISFSPAVDFFSLWKPHCYQTKDAFDFISYIDDAEYVVTSSFHCTAFSIIFQKQFLSIGIGNNSGRVTSLLEMLGIPDHYQTSAGKYPSDIDNYAPITERLRKEIDDSIIFLKKSLL